MYIVDNLIRLYNSSSRGSTNHVLASYFLLHARKMNHKKLLDVSKETNISNSSITRFCKSAGYDTFASFCDILYLDVKKIEHQFIHRFKKEKSLKIDDKTKTRLDELVTDLKSANRVVIYGTPKYTSYFDDVIKFLFYSGVSVERCIGWDIREKEDVFSELENKDVILLVDPRYSIQVFLEETETSLGSISSITEAKAKKYFFGESEEDYSNIKAIQLKKHKDYAYVLSTIDNTNYILYQLMEGEKNEHSDF